MNLLDPSTPEGASLEWELGEDIHISIGVGRFEYDPQGRMKRSAWPLNGSPRTIGQTMIFTNPRY